MQMWFALTLVLIACDENPEGDRVAEILALEADTVLGQERYDDNCAVCHGELGEGTPSGASLQSSSAAGVIQSILEPPTVGMDGFASILSDQDIRDLSAYVESL